MTSWRKINRAGAVSASSFSAVTGFCRSAVHLRDGRLDGVDTLAETVFFDFSRYEVFHA